MNSSMATHQTNLINQLQQGFSALNLDLPVNPWLDYLYLLDKWNQTYNLTAVRALEDMISRHVLDSLAVIPYIQGQVIADVGTGAGLPGIPLALYFPNKQFVLVESLGKKVRFLETAVRSLNLKNVTVVAQRAEDYRDTLRFDTVISRAVGRIDQLIQWTEPMLAEGGQWVAMKGKFPEEELRLLTRSYQVHSYQVPGLEGERCVVCIKS